MEAISKCIKAQKGTVNGPNRFMNNKSCQISFCDEMAGFVNNGRPVGIIDLDFSKIFATFSDSILTGKLRRFLPNG